MVKPTSKQVKIAGVVFAVVALVVTGVVGTLSYQKFIDRVEARGVEDYKLMQCDKFTHDDNSATWLECEATRLEQ